MDLPTKTTTLTLSPSGSGVQKGYRGKQPKISSTKGKRPIGVLMSKEESQKPKKLKRGIITIEDKVDLAKERRLLVYIGIRQAKIEKSIESYNKEEEQEWLNREQVIDRLCGFGRRGLRSCLEG